MTEILLLHVVAAVAAVNTFKLFGCLFSKPFEYLIFSCGIINESDAKDEGEKNYSQPP